MNKKLLVAAIAAALAVPVAAPSIALAQVTLSGKVGVMWQNARFSGSTLARTGNTSFNSINDNSSSITFSVREDLGGGLAAYGRMELRQTVDSGGAFGGGGSASPPQWFGLESKTWGNLRVGSLTGLHYVTGPDFPALRGTVFNSANGLLAGFATFAGPLVATSGAANTTGTPRLVNAIAWDSLNYGGFKMTLAYSTNPAGVDADLGAVARKGRSWDLIPQFIASNWNVGWSYRDAKPDNGAGALAATLVDLKDHRIYGEYLFANGFSVGGAWGKLKRKNVGAVAPGDITERAAWNLQGGWASGPHSVGVAFSRAQKDKKLAGTGGVIGADTGASAIQAAYQYSLSKRTNAFVSWLRLSNQAAANYGAGFWQTPPYTTAGFATQPGDDVNNLMFGMNHSF